MSCPTFVGRGGGCKRNFSLIGGFFNIPPNKGNLSAHKDLLQEIVS